MRAVAIVGTVSQVGKSLLVTALCRLLSRRGWRVTPFKAQSLVTTSYITVSGVEIDYAQAVQAWAAGTVPRAEMNPIVLKPQDSQHVEVIFKGKPIGVFSLEDYTKRYTEQSWQVVTLALQQLAEEFDIVVCEGFGNPVETVLQPWDVSNMRIAKYLGAPTILMVSADRGGILAQVVGTLELMQPQDRKLVRGIVLNNADRESSALQTGMKWIQDRSGIPVLGAVPHLSQPSLPDGSLTVIEKYGRRAPSAEDITIAVIHLPRISNFTDFEPLEAEASVTVKYLHPRDPLGHPDAVILPGSKATIADLLVLQKSGMGETLKNYVAAGGTVLGICGGFQMMGKALYDPEGLEGSEHRYRGLGLLPIKTIISGQKIARQRQVTSIYPEVGLPISGYELYHGRTSLADLDPAEQTDQFKCSQLFDEPGLGIVDPNLSVWGTYLHGLFDNGPWRRSWLNRLRQRRGFKFLPTGIANYREQREALLNNLADSVEFYLDLSTILG